MSTTQHAGQLSVQEDTLFGTGIGEWHSRGSARERFPDGK